jgi:hypothetical protein
MATQRVYITNPHSLFRKYAQLVTWFANTPQGRSYLNLAFSEPIGLFLPNGYHKILAVEKKVYTAEATIFSRAIYSSLLSPALRKFDLMQPIIKDFSEAKKVFLWILGFNTEEIAPRLVRHTLHDTLTVFPDADPETTSVDGRVYRTGVSEAFSTIRTSGGTNADPSVDGSDGVGVRMFASATQGGSGFLQSLVRSITLFDTSSLTSAATISSTTASLYVLGRNIAFLNFLVNLVACSPASNTDLAVTDYNIANWTMTLQSDTETAVNSLTLSAYNDFPLNSTGLSSIAKTGITKFGWVTNYDRSNTNPNYNSNNQDDRFNFAYAEHTVAQPPKLTITYTGVTRSFGYSFFM